MARGLRPARRVLRGGQVLNVFTGEFLQADVALCGEWIVGVGRYRGDEEVDCTGKTIVPGFIDAHMHIESTMTTPRRLAQQVAPHGTTTLIADPHELANVAGLPALRWLLGECAGAACDIRVMLPSCVPATPFEDNGATLTADDLLPLRGHPQVLGLGEMMDYPGVLAGEEQPLRKLAAFAGRPVDGHAPLLSGADLQAYRLAGILTEHECSQPEEALEKLRAGFFLLAREGSAAHNLAAVLEAVQGAGLGYERIAFCTDDLHLEELARLGHMERMVRRAIALGAPPADAYRMASYNAAQCYGLRDRGAVAAGYRADLVVLKDLEQVAIDRVYYRGEPVGPGLPDGPLPPALCASVRLAPLGEGALRLPITRSPSPVLQLVPQQIATRLVYAPLPVRGGEFAPNARYQKLAVLERHRATGQVGLGVVEGFGLHGALASTVSHDSHNLVVVGDNDADMRLAAEALAACGGGFAAACEGRLLGRLELPIGGLVSAAPAGQLIDAAARLAECLREMGLPPGHDPFLTLAFLALPVIPEARVTDRGFFEVARRRYLPY